jgi:hypothetical protein
LRFYFCFSSLRSFDRLEADNLEAIAHAVGTNIGRSTLNIIAALDRPAFIPLTLFWNMFTLAVPRTQSKELLALADVTTNITLNNPRHRRYLNFIAVLQILHLFPSSVTVDVSRNASPKHDKSYKLCVGISL